MYCHWLTAQACDKAGRPCLRFTRWPYAPCTRIASFPRSRNYIYVGAYCRDISLCRCHRPQAGRRLCVEQSACDVKLQLTYSIRAKQHQLQWGCGRQSNVTVSRGAAAPYVHVRVGTVPFEQHTEASPHALPLPFWLFLLTRHVVWPHDPHWSRNTGPDHKAMAARIVVELNVT